MKLDYKRTFFIGLAFLSICAFWQMYDSIVPLILQNSFDLGETAIGAIMAIDNVLAVFLLPLIGGLSDRVNTRLGKRTPFIIVGTAAAVVLMMLLPVADQQTNFWMFIVVLAFTLLAMASYRSPAVALMPDLTPKPLRSKANAIINLMGAIGGVYTLALISMLVPDGYRPDYTAVFAGVAFIMVLAVVMLLITIREKKLAEQIEKEMVEQIEPEHPDGEEKDVSVPVETSDKLPRDVQRSLNLILVSIFLWFTAYNALTTTFSRYWVTVWGMEGGGFADCLMIATVAAICSYIPIGIVSAKIGRKKTIIIGLVMMLISFASMFFYPTYHFTANIFFALVGIGWASVSVNSLPMVVEMSKVSDIGKYTGLYYTFSMSAQIFTPIASGLLIEYISYDTLFPYSIFFTVCAIVTMMLVKHGDVKPEAKKSLLENFDVDD